MLDLGTGSGCLVLALLTALGESSRGVGLDLSEKALALVCTPTYHVQVFVAAYQHLYVYRVYASAIYRGL